MRVLILTYPLTPVSAAACGGTEQIAWLLLRGLRQQPSLDLTWVGAEGSDSRAGGQFISWPDLLTRFAHGLSLPSLITPASLRNLEERCNAAALGLLRARPFDLIHIQGASFYHAAARVAQPVLMTLHLARGLYPAYFPPPAANLHLQCVSETQLRFYGSAACCGCIPNGISLGAYRARPALPASRAPLLYLGRICPEKAPDLAIRLARATRRQLWIVGSVAPFPSHLGYWRDHIVPFLGPDIRWLPPPSPAVKRALLRAAAAVVIPSRVAETSSLVAMEAAASGVPVLALRRGALPEIVSHGETGYVEDDCGGMAAALPRLQLIAPAACRQFAERHFCARRMARQYAALYRRLTASRAAA